MTRSVASGFKNPVKVSYRLKICILLSKPTAQSTRSRLTFGGDYETGSLIDGVEVTLSTHL